MTFCKKPTLNSHILLDIQIYLLFPIDLYMREDKDNQPALGNKVTNEQD